MNIKKKISGFIAAAICCTMLTGTAVYAEGYPVKAGSSQSSSSSENKSIWDETKEIAGASYNSKYIKWVKKYSEKEQKNTVSFGKSRTKKAFEKFYKASSKEEIQVKLNIINKTEIASIVIKDDNIKVVMYTDGSAFALYSNPKKITMLDIGEKEKIVMPLTDDDYDDLGLDTDDLTSETDINESFGIKDNAKGKLFKFKSNDKIYYYEEFESGDYYGKLGFLFTEKGTPIAVNVDGDIACFRMYYKVDDSEFDIPKGYKTVDYD